MLCFSAQTFDLLCSILCSCKRFVLKNLAVLLEYIHLHHKIFNVVHSSIREYLKLYTQTVAQIIIVESVLIFNHIFNQALPIMLALQGRIQDGAFGANAPPPSALHNKINRDSLIERSLTIILFNRVTH